jgi:hypothetical protein
MLWLRGRHLEEPPTWQDTVRDAEARVAQWARKRLKLADGEVLFDDLWVSHKVSFSRLQNGKCGYCEMSIAADPNGGDIEHYRPKAELTELFDDPSTWGEEVEGHNSRDPAKRRRVRLVGRGYWWLAYDWRNYLLSCGTCNEKWKGNLFPIEGGHRRPPTRRSYVKERALLLNPYGDVDPAAHLEFDKVGLVVPRADSAIGLETIRTCHLGRESLRRSREPIAKAAWPLITRVLKELRKNPHNEPRLRRAIRRLLNLGASKRQHAGMVRILWAHRDTFGLTWEHLRALYKKLKPDV